MVELPRGPRAAIESLFKIAMRDTGQSRRVWRRPKEAAEPEAFDEHDNRRHQCTRDGR
jgi:hypothetical protein